MIKVILASSAGKEWAFRISGTTAGMCMHLFCLRFPKKKIRRPETRCSAMVEAWLDDVDEMDAVFLSENFRTKIDPDHADFKGLSSVVRIVSEEIVVIKQQ